MTWHWEITGRLTHGYPCIRNCISPHSCQITGEFVGVGCKGTELGPLRGSRFNSRTMMEGEGRIIDRSHLISSNPFSSFILESLDIIRDERRRPLLATVRRPSCLTWIPGRTGCLTLSYSIGKVNNSPSSLAPGRAILRPPHPKEWKKKWLSSWARAHGTVAFARFFQWL